MKYFTTVLICFLAIHICLADEQKITTATIDQATVTTAKVPDISEIVKGMTDGLPPGAAGVANATDGKCECGVFGTELVKKDDKAILIQKPMNVSCTAAGEEICLKLCTTLARAAKERGPTLLCASLGHVDKLKASLFSRICDAEKWNYTGLTSPDEMCCHANEVVSCKDEGENHPENRL